MEKLLLKICFVLSISLNLIVMSALGWYLMKKGGIQYLKNKYKNSPTVDISQIRSPSYLANLSKFDILPKNRGDIIFIGDSITAGVDWTKLFQDIRVRNLGIGFDATSLLLQRLDRVVDLKPSKVFIMVGITDLNNLHSSIPEIIDNYHEIIRTIQKGSGDTKIYFQSVLPKQRHASSYIALNDDIVDLNKALRVICTQYEGVTYIDLHTLFKSESNQLNQNYTYDGGHLNGKGYLVWKSAVERYVNE